MLERKKKERSALIKTQANTQGRKSEKVKVERAQVARKARLIVLLGDFYRKFADEQSSRRPVK